MSIPDNIILTYKNKNIPKYVINNIIKLNSDKNILFFDDEDIRIFLKKHYDSSYLDFFNSLEKGCSRADFFRYCYLFQYGGYYCDIDIEHIAPIRSYTEPSLEFLSVRSVIPFTIFQALLFCESNHPIIEKCIEDMMNPINKLHEFYNCTEDMYKNTAIYLNKNIDINTMKPQTFVVDVDKKLKLLVECFNFITNEHLCITENMVVAKSRYSTYKREIGFIEK